MFTGLIQALGIIKPQGSDRFAIEIRPDCDRTILSDLAIGDSIAVDGVCLTAEEVLPDGFVATASPETLQRTSLGQRSQTGNYVNLEASVRVGSKLGGHFVTGHVDAVGYLSESIQTERAWEMSFVSSGDGSQWQQQIARYLVAKGSIAVNGISLTVADCHADGSWFKVAVIPHTYANTNLCYLESGSLVNLESDILGKYVDKLLKSGSGSESPQEDISISFLAEHGYW
ncbi:MAG: riboflavin synthase [Kamptonema sp. SIO1D9]|nr:riboflavin synthase [Kamptonema sp. SIO1D9]